MILPCGQNLFFEDSDPRTGRPVVLFQIPICPFTRPPLRIICPILWLVIEAVSLSAAGSRWSAWRRRGGRGRRWGWRGRVEAEMAVLVGRAGGVVVRAGAGVGLEWITASAE